MRDVQEARETYKQEYKDPNAVVNVAYAITTIGLYAISYAICYLLVDQVLHFGTFLERIGISRAGNFAIAYFACKETSPILPWLTVLLVPDVTKLLQKGDTDDVQASDNVEQVDFVHFALSDDGDLSGRRGGSLLRKVGWFTMGVVEDVLYLVKRVF